MIKSPTYLTLSPLMEIDLMRRHASSATALLKNLANEERLMLLCQLVEGERSVGELETLTGIRQPTLSQQLGVLRNENLVTTRRDGKRIFYAVASEDALAILSALYGIFCRPNAPHC